MIMSQDEQDDLWNAIKARIPKDSNFICFVQLNEEDCTCVSTLQGPQMIAFLMATLDAFMKRYKGSNP